MRKIVIVDEYIPASCKECKFFSISGEKNVTGKCEVRDETLTRRPERCPIRPLSLIERSLELINPYFHRREEDDD